MEEEEAGLSPGPHFAPESEMMEDPMGDPMEEAAPEGSKFQEVVKAAAELRNMADRLESLVTVADLPKMAKGGMAYNPSVVAEEGPERVIPTSNINLGQGNDQRGLEGQRKQVFDKMLNVFERGGVAAMRKNLPPEVREGIADMERERADIYREIEDRRTFA
jgi:hypothetical protein